MMVIIYITAALTRDLASCKNSEGEGPFTLRASKKRDKMTSEVSYSGDCYLNSTTFTRPKLLRERRTLSILMTDSVWYYCSEVSIVELLSYHQ